MAMARFSSYARLARLHQPVGIWLLLWPCIWALVLASGGWPPPDMLVLFALGAVLMRSAGCIINDMADRDFDRQVARTRTRPLASGELGLRQATLLLVLLLALSLLVALALGASVVLWGALSLVPVAAYPFMKRISWWPQLFLGLTFNWGALLGWVAVHGTPQWPAFALYLGGVFWTLAYDTIYAFQDREDDARIGVKSTARRLGAHSKPFIALCYALAALCWWAASSWHAGSAAMLALVLAVQSVQLWRLPLADGVQCRRVFVANSWLGIVITIAFILSNN
jgi:4-hydroxybenzoate polyprenyltransferase